MAWLSELLVLPNPQNHLEETGAAHSLSESRLTLLLFPTQKIVKFETIEM